MSAPGAVAPSPSASHPSAPQPGAAGPTEAGARALRVLVADDEAVTVELITFVLHHAGCDVVGVTTCFDALARALDDPLPDVILLDALMPFLSGLEVCRRLRALERTRTVPIGIFSSADEGDVAWAAAGANAFLPKPFNVRRLPAFVRALAAGGGGSAA